MLRGLLIKDLLILKKALLMGCVILGFYSILGVYGDDVSSFSAFLLLFFGLISTTSYAYDEQARWAPYALATTINRTKLVQSKYLLSFIMITLGFLYTFILTLIHQIIHSSEFVLTISPVTWGALYVSLLFNFILLPILFKLGSENGRIIIFALCALPTVLIVILDKYNLLPDINQSTIESITKYLPYIGVISILIFWSLSYTICLGIVKKKDY